MSLTEKLHASGFIVSEGEGNISRDNAILIAGQNLAAGTVLGRIGLAAAASETHAGNTGTGVMTLDAVNPVRAGAKQGVYTVTLITVAAGGGVFRVEDPDGNVIGDIAVGATFDDDIKFVIADGAPDFIVGDKFLITVAAGSNKFTAVAAAAQDGSQVAAAILVAPVDASAADVPCVILSRYAEVNAYELTWPAGISAPNKATAIAQLAAQGIIVRP
jgi:hypothetical protein